MTGTATRPTSRAAARRTGPLAGLATPAGRARLQTVLLSAVWVGVFGPLLVDSLTSAKGFTPITGPGETLSGLAGAVTTAGNALVVLVCAGVALTVLRTVAWRRLPVLAVLLALWVVVVAQLVLDGRRPGAPALVYPAVAVAFWALRPSRDAIRTVGLLVALTAVVSLVLGAFLPDAGRYPAEAAGLDKAVSAVGVLSGIMPTGNNLGLVLVLGLPAVVTLRRSSVRLAALGAVLLALAWTSSRTSWVAAVVVVVSLLVVRVPWRRQWFAAAGLVGLTLVGFVIPFVTTDPTAFVNRASFWIPSLADWRQHVLTGSGADYFKRLADTSENLGGFAYHAHNQWVQLLVTGGLVLTVLVVGLLVVAGVRAVQAAGGSGAVAGWGVGWLAGLLTVAVLEVPLGFVDRMMFLPVTLVPLCLLVCQDPAVLGRRATAGTRDRTSTRGRGAVKLSSDATGSPLGAPRG